MPEEFHIITPGEIEGGTEVPADTSAAVQIVADNIDAILALAATIDDSGNITMINIDGNLTTIKIRRDTAANWDSNDPVLISGEIGVNLSAVDPYEMKIGDGTKRWSQLTNFLLLADFGNADLQAAVTEAETARDDAQEFAGVAEQNAGEASDSMGAAAASAQLAQDWASAAETTPLPGGKKSAEVSAGIAAQIAITSRLIDRSPLITANETVTSGMLFKKRRYAGAGDITITIPTSVYSSTDDREAWMIYRKEGNGNINVVAAAGGSNLQAPVVKATGSYPFRNMGSSTAGASIAFTGSISVPAVTAGKLAFAVELHTDSGVQAMSAPSLTGALTATMTQRLPLQTGYNLSGDAAVFDCPLTSFAGGTINFSITVGVNVHLSIVHFFAVEGHGGEMKLPVDFNFPTNAAAANISLPLLAVPASSLMMGVAFMRGSEGNVTFTSFSSNLSLMGSGVTTGANDVTASDTGNNKNSAWGRGAGVNSVAGDITISANFSSAFTFPRLLGMCYPPKTVAGAGDLILKTEAGRTALTVLNGEMELLFDPDGKTVVVKTPKP